RDSRAIGRRRGNAAARVEGAIRRPGGAGDPRARRGPHPARRRLRAPALLRHPQWSAAGGGHRGPRRRSGGGARRRSVTKQRETRDRVLDLIEGLAVGEAIPSERQLSVDLGVSRLTVRAALDDLAREGYLIRRRGSGTFVSEPKIAQELTMTSFTEDMRRRGMEPGSRTLGLEVVPAGARLGRFLHVSPSERIVVAKRLRLADRETMAIETLHVREELVPGLTRRDLDGKSLYELLRDRFGLIIAG